MNGKANKSLLARDKFMPEIHSRQTWLKYIDCGPLTKNKERM